MPVGTVGTGPSLMIQPTKKPLAPQGIGGIGGESDSGGPENHIHAATQMLLRDMFEAPGEHARAALQVIRGADSAPAKEAGMTAAQAALAAGVSPFRP